jgi:beta-xylosidase
MTDDAVRFTNPVLSGDRPDPAVIRVDDEYWLTYSSFESAPGLPLYRSTDQVNWSFEGSALPEPLGSAFAVGIAEHGGRFFIYRSRSRSTSSSGRVRPRPGSSSSSTIACSAAWVWMASGC